VSRIRPAAIIALAVLVPLTVTARLSNAEDDVASSLFGASSDRFLNFTVAEPATAPAWMIDPFDDEARADTASDGDDEGDPEPTVDERIKKLEESLTKVDSSLNKFDDAERKKKADAASKPTLKVGGRIHMDFWDFLDQSDGIGFFEHPTPGAQFGQDPDDTFVFRRIRLELQGDIPDNMLWRTQIDFNNPNLPEMKDVYLGFKELPGNQTLLIGNQKRPLGLDHLNSSRFNVFVERPLAVEAFNSDARRPGILMYGVSDDESINWQYGTFYLENISNDGRYIGDARQMSINGRLAGSPWYDESTDGRGYFHLGIAGMAAKPDGNATAADPNGNESRFSTRPEARSQTRWFDTGSNGIPGAEWFETIGVETILNVGPTQICGEYQSTFTQRSGFGDTHFHGAYLYASYFLTGEHIPYNRKLGTLDRVQPYENFFLVDRQNGGHATGWGAWNVAARYSYLDLTDKDVLGGVGHAGTLALNWHWNAYAKVQFDLSYGQITDHKNVGGYTGGDYTLCGTRFAIDF